MDLGSTVPYLNLSIFDLLVALGVVVVGFFLAKLSVYLFKKSLKKTKMPSLIRDFLGRFFSILLYIVVLFVVLAVLGIDVSSAVLGLSAILGIILGFGLQDTVNNIFSGIWIAMLRPIDEDERVEVFGEEGIVTSVGLMATKLLKRDNTMVMVSNKLVWDQAIKNYSRMPKRRIDIPVGISYEGDIDKAVEVALDFLKDHEAVLDEPEPQVSVTELDDSSVNLMLKGWTDKGEFWQVRFDLTEGIFKAYTESDIEIPYPQRDINIDGEITQEE